MGNRSGPDQDKLTGISLPSELSKGAVAAWLANLPLANLEYSSKALLALLGELNRQEHRELVQQFDLIEVLRPQAIMLTRQGAERLQGDVAFPLTPKYKAMAQVGVLMTEALGRGYLTLASSVDFLNDRITSSRSRALVIFRALEASCLALLRYRLAYESPGKGYWRNVYGLYTLAEGCGLQLETVDAAAGEAVQGTIQAKFNQIVLFALANTQRHRVREIQQIDELLSRFAKLAVLRPVSGNENERALFFCDLAGDLPPRLCSAMAGLPGVACRIIETRPLVEGVLQHYADPTRLVMDSPRPGKELLKRLLRALSGTERRKFQRFPESGDRSLIAGLEQIISLLTSQPGASRLPKLASTAVQYKGIKWLDIPNYSLETVSEGSLGDFGNKVRSEVAIGRALDSNPEGVMRSQQVWSTADFVPSTGADSVAKVNTALLNASAKGVCLSWADRSDSCVRVGELVGMPVDEGDLHVGVIRWLNHNAKSELVLGVELLAPSVKGVKVTLANHVDYQRPGLWIPENRKLGQPASLLVQPAGFVSGQSVFLEAEQSRLCYRLEKLEESSPSFQRFSMVEMESLPETFI